MRRRPSGQGSPRIRLSQPTGLPHPAGMKLQFIGSGDAMGTGGRFNTCFRLEHSAGSVLIDFGASSMVALRHHGVDPNSIDAIFITHLHGDHFGGLPFFLLDAQLYSRRRQPLIIAGPYGLEERLMQLREVLFPGSSDVTLKFGLDIIEIAPGETRDIAGVTLSAFPMRHPCGAPPLGLRIAADGKSVAYTGDTEWTDDILALSNNVDLFIIECLGYDRPVPHHLNYHLICDHAHEITARRIVLTHLGPDMLAHSKEARFETASDGLILDV